MFRILHVDDEKLENRLLAHQIKEVADDLELSWADSGQTALEILQNESFDCILSDYQMPGMDGLQFLEEVRGQKLDIPFILLTGQGHEQLAVKALRSGVNDYFSKELGFAHFSRLVHSIREAIKARSSDKKHKKTQTLLAESDKRFEMAMEATRDGIFDWNLITGDIYYSPGWKSMLGYEYHELPNDFSVWEELTDPEGETRAKRMMEKVTNREVDRFQVEFKMKHKDGHWVDILSRANAYFDDSGQAVRVVGTHVDISDRKIVEKKLKFSQEILQEAQEVAQLGYYILDVKTGKWESSDVLDQIFEIDDNYPKDVSGWAELIHPEDRERIHSYLMNDVMAAGQKFDKKYRLITKTGKTKWVHGLGHLKYDQDGDVTSMLGTIRDINDEVNSQNQLKSRNAWLDSLFKAVPFGVGIVKNQIFLEINEQFTDITGWRPEDLIGKHTNAIYINPELEQKIHQEFVSQIKSKGYGSTATQIKTKDGKIMDVQINVTVISHDDDYPKLAFTIIDLTEPQKLKRELEKERLISSFIIEGTNAATWQWNVQTGETIFNEKWAGMMGYTLAELAPITEETWCKFTHPDDQAKLNEIIMDHFNDRTEMIDARVRVKHKQGHWVWTHIRGKLQTRTQDGQSEWAYGANTDISETMAMMSELNKVTKAMSEYTSELEDKKARLTNILAGTRSGTWEWNVQTEETTFNDRWAEILGYTLEELSPVSIQTWVDLCHPDDLEFSNDLIQRHFAGELDYYECEARMKHKDGHWVWVKDRGKVISWTEDGKPLLMMGTHQDISQRKQAELSLMQSKKELEQANKELESFSYTVSHDLKAPIRHIESFLEIFKENYLDDLCEDARSIIQDIAKAAERMRQLVEAILSLSRSSTTEIKREEIDLTYQAEKVVEGLKLQDSERQVEFKIAADLRACGDTNLVKGVLENLLGNAWKYSAKQDRSIIEFGFRKQGGEEQYYVRDNGVGFPQERAEELFIAFRRLHPVSEFKGTGIGLATVKRIVERHGGRIWAESKPGEGATFFFTLKE